MKTLGLPAIVLTWAIALTWILTGLPRTLAAQSIAAESSWSQFLGPRGNGHAAADVALPDRLDDAGALAWQVPIPGRGWSSPVIVGDEVWLTTAIEHELPEAERAERLKDAPPNGGSSAFQRIDFQALCLDRASGALQATIDLFSITDPPLIHTLNSFASPTPVSDGQHVYCSFGAFGMAAIDRQTRKVVWTSQEDDIDHETGPGSSPILYRDLLIVHFDGTDQQYVSAFRCSDGQRVWKTERSGEMNPVGMYRKAFSTPIVYQQGDRDVLISPAANWIYGYDPISGDELWKISYGQLGFSNVARPILDGSTVYVCTCFMQSNLLAIDLAGNSPPSEDAIQWRYKGQVPNMSTPVIVDDGIYFVSDRGIATCVDKRSGERMWQARLGSGYSASPIYADGRLFFGDQDGKLHVVVPQVTDLNEAETLELDSPIMASPAAVGSALFVRTRQSLYCFGNAN